MGRPREHGTPAAQARWALGARLLTGAARLAPGRTRRRWRELDRTSAQRGSTGTRPEAVAQGRVTWNPLETLASVGTLNVRSSSDGGVKTGDVAK
jgi:hypothetical protein